MENILPTHLPEVLYGSSEPSVSKQLSVLEKRGTIRKIAPRLYTSNLNERAEVVVRRNLFSILGHLYPGSVLSHRSALEFQPTSTGQLFVTYQYMRKASLPGITLRFLKGPGPIEGDNPVSGALYASQRERALLENFQQSRKSGPDSKTLPLSRIEERLEQIIRVNGEAALNAVRDRARWVAEVLDMQQEFLKLNKTTILKEQSSK